MKYAARHGGGGMRFGIFYEHQLPRPWGPDAEHRLLSDSLEQVELADRAGIDYVWEVEHHFLAEYSHSSAPEVFLAAASQRTRRIRLGHGIIQAPQAVNHPARIAERIAVLDLVSGGRVEFGTGESSSAAELGGFGVPREAKRAMWEETLDAVTRMFTENPFAGYDGDFLRMPPRNVVPKPLQKPHPPLWVACSRRETIHLAARSGIGALSFSFVEPEEAAHWEIVSANAAPLAIRLLQAGLGSLRGAIGTPAQVTDLIARYRAAGVDQVMFVMQAGRNRHEHICESIELFAREVLPRFAEGRDAAEAAKADRLAAAVDKALARRSGPRGLPAPYPIDEEAELAAARRSRHVPLRDLAGQARRSAGESARQRLQAGARALAGRATDGRIERVLGGAAAQRALFAVMASGFDAEKAAGFTGRIVYDLGSSDGSRRSWTIEVKGRRATALQGGAADAALTIHATLADFVRVIADAGSFLPLVLDGRLTMDGDLGLANRLADMFGGRSTF